jgi:hypothetical protein
VTGTAWKAVGTAKTRVESVTSAYRQSFLKFLLDFFLKFPQNVFMSSVLYILASAYLLISAYLASQDLREEYKVNRSISPSKLLSTFLMFWAYGAGLVILTLGFLAVWLIYGTLSINAYSKTYPKRFNQIIKYSLLAFVTGTLLTIPYAPTISALLVRQFIGWAFFVCVLIGVLIWKEKRNVK